MNMSDHIRNVAETARRGGKAIRQPILQCSAPVTLVDGVTIYISHTASTDTSQCQLNKIILYPYGSFYPIVNYNKYNFIPGDCK